MAMEASRDGAAEDRRTQDRARRAQHRQTRCVMLLPEDLAGKRVLDIGCRKGLGAFKIADRVGPHGFVVGVDGSPEHLEVARERACEQHWAQEHWGDYLQFVCASASNLEEAGLTAASFDVVVVNSVLNLEPSLEAALAQIARVLVPGGLLYHDAVLACESLPIEVVQPCREAANVFGCAPTWDRLGAALGRAGFSRWTCRGEKLLEPPAGDVRDELAPYRFGSAVVEAYR